MLSTVWAVAIGVAAFVAGWAAKSIRVELDEDEADDRAADEYDRKHHIGRYAE